MISWEDFEKINILTGTIVGVNDFPIARRAAYQLQIDFGPSGIKQSSAQITKHYSKEQLLGQQVVAVVNFPPKQIANFYSECLVLGVYDKDNEIILLQPERAVDNGQKIG
jgi:tRNA-binding protein